MVAGTTMIPFPMGAIRMRVAARQLLKKVHNAKEQLETIAIAGNMEDNPDNSSFASIEPFKLLPMRKLIATMNMTLDGFCDHTAGIADDETHQHYTDLLNSADTIVHGRITYQLMEDYWPGVVRNPTGNKATDDFATAIDKIEKIVFSNTLKSTDWNNTRIVKGSVQEKISTLKQKEAGDILVGSPSLIVACTNLGLVDEYQISVHPFIEGKGLLLFKNIQDRIELRLLKTKTFACGVVTFYYETARK